ncbi:hypothetical protein [Lactococcus lactis]|uniref:hypothetical protein n=1 Tax=Lactococcus lactis TaxID=1358 RepID=UPI001D180D66|nr:hypothetical protein [Lactococcus lactis]MCC4121329.1 hypothetical protein [Lactococcus lactis]
MNKDTIKMILDRNEIADSEKLSKALEEIFSTLANDTNFASALSNKQTQSSQRNDRLAGRARFL